MPQKVYGAKEYRDYIRFKIEENSDTRGYQSLLADAAGCQRSFLSQVLNSHIQLTPDHAAGMAKFWGLGGDETDYFLALVNLARANSPALKQLLTRKLGEIRERNEDIGRRLPQAKSLIGQHEVVYYSAWYMSAVHLILGIPKYRTAKAIADKLKMPIHLIQASLAGLEQLELIERKGEGWVVKKMDLHLGNKSLFAANYHSNWRQKAILRIQEQDPDDIHYTGIHTLALKDIEKLKELLRDAIEKSRQIIAPSAEEELVCFSCDLFRL